jgi:hypothetical protein
VSFFIAPPLGSLAAPAGATLRTIRLTGLLRKKPWKRGFFYGPDHDGDEPAAGVRGGPGKTTLITVGMGEAAIAANNAAGQIRGEKVQPRYSTD